MANTANTGTHGKQWERREEKKERKNKKGAKETKEPQGNKVKDPFGPSLAAAVVTCLSHGDVVHGGDRHILRHVAVSSKGRAGTGAQRPQQFSGLLNDWERSRRERYCDPHSVRPLSKYNMLVGDHLARCGTAQPSAARLVPSKHVTAQHDAAQNIAFEHSIARHSAARCIVGQPIPSENRTAQRGTVQHGAGQSTCITARWSASHTAAHPPYSAGTCRTDSAQPRVVNCGQPDFPHVAALVPLCGERAEELPKNTNCKNKERKGKCLLGAKGLKNVSRFNAPERRSRALADAEPRPPEPRAWPRWPRAPTRWPPAAAPLRHPAALVPAPCWWPGEGVAGASGLRSVQLARAAWAGWC